MATFFYPHAYMRDRHLETIRRWPKSDALNPEIAAGRQGAQVSASTAKSTGVRKNWRQIIPIPNIKSRPRRAPREAIIYCWGGIITTGPYILDLDNPWALTGYNYRAMTLFRPLFKWLLGSARCLEIRCMSATCRESLRILFGQKIYDKARVHYPLVPNIQAHIEPAQDRVCRFLFIGTQFEIKGGAALLRAFKRAYSDNPGIQLDMITHLPDDYKPLLQGTPGIRVHSAHFSREHIYEQFMRSADVLILPTYVDSFGMVALEALAHGLAVIATDVYALREMVHDGVNGALLKPPISCWNGYMPSHLMHHLEQSRDLIRATDTTNFEHQLTQSILNLSTDRDQLYAARQASLDIFQSLYRSDEPSHG